MVNATHRIEEKDVGVWGQIIQQFCSLSQCLLIKCSLKFDESTPSFCHERRVDSCDRAMTGLLTAVWKIPVEISPWRESWVTGPLSWASTSRDTCHSVGPWQAPATVSLTSLTHSLTSPCKKSQDWKFGSDWTFQLDVCRQYDKISKAIPGPGPFPVL